MTTLKADSKRILEEFQELTSVDCISFQERAIADRLKKKLTALGFTVEEDDAGEFYGSDTGNLYGYLPGTLPGPPILLSAHMDTVEPGCGKKAVVHEDGRITSARDTILGADDVCGLVEILEGIRILKEQGIPHRAVEVLFPVAEELFIKGTNRFDFGRIRAKEAYVLDLSNEVGTAALRAPSLISFCINVKGKSSHAGFNPEEGIHAIQLMSRAIGSLPVGRIGDDTTLNIGTIQGGNLVNIVPDTCTCKGEIRSYSHEKALQMLEMVRHTFETILEGTGGSFSCESEVNLVAYEVKEEEPVVRQFVKACQALGISPKLTSTFGGSDNNNFALHGIRGIVLSCGMYQCHSVEEYTTLEDLNKGAALIATILTQY